MEHLLESLRSIRDLTESLDYEDGDVSGKLAAYEKAVDEIRDIAYAAINASAPSPSECPVRPPTDDERWQLVEWLRLSGYGAEDAHLIAGYAYAAIFDQYISGDTGYAG